MSSLRKKLKKQESFTKHKFSGSQLKLGSNCKCFLSPNSTSFSAGPVGQEAS